MVSDTVWRPPSPALLDYVTSKAALVGLTRMLALTLGGDGIAVNAVTPGLTRTPAAEAGIPEAAFEDVTAAQEMSRSLTPEDVAGTVAFLCTDAAQALTGQTSTVLTAAWCCIAGRSWRRGRVAGTARRRPSLSRRRARARRTRAPPGRA